ncbi:anion exchange protein 3-like isoform X2 [Macrobrachium nipponense]|uniref:anion exchange protein 3-like isoform X2 n=1 Tax=Macrobrachium nipponense TaxID=159736 RepID=UPI0030C83596
MMDPHNETEKENKNNNDEDNEQQPQPVDFPLGAVLLDLEERDLPSIAARVVDKMIACDQIPPDQREAVVSILLLRHRHIRDSHSSLRRSSRGSKSARGSYDDKLATTPVSLSLDGGSSLRASVRKAGLSKLFHVNAFAGFRRQNAEDNIPLNGNVTKEESQDKKGVNRVESYTQIDIEDLSPKEREARESARRKIPEGAEATAVLVGAVDFLKQPTIAFVRLAEGVMMDNLVEVPIPVRFMFVLLGPFHGEMDYHEVGRSISTLMTDKGFQEVAYRAQSRGQLLSAINEFLNASIVLPPSDWNNKDLVPVDDTRAKANQIMHKNESMRARKQSAQGAAVTPVSSGNQAGGDRKPPPRDPLIRHGKLFYGMIQDIKIRYPKYLSDIKDGISSQVLATAFFIFFACLSPAITFGGMYGDQMDNLIGVGETLLLTCINGVIFAVFSCQPLIIIGATGPIMVFDFSLYKFCQSNDIDFLSIRVWIGLWMTVVTIIIAAFEGVVIVKKFTRFTEEIFASLVCLIFIYEAIAKLVAIFIAHPLQATYEVKDSSNSSIVSGIIENGTLFNGTDEDGTEIEDAVVSLTAQPNTALLSFILTMGTFIIAIKLKNFRNSKFLGRSVRRALGDFGVPISIVLMVSLDVLIKDTYTDKLTMPAGLSPSNPEVRDWLINPFGAFEPLPVWCMIAAAPVSILLLILVFLEGNICHLILSKPEKNMVKGTGFHFDLVLCGVMNFASGILGAPFMGPGCVRTISHVASLTIMSTNQPAGESPKIQGVHEQRVSGFTVALLVGMGVFLTAVLNLVPKAVLLGVFLYMGISAAAAIQFVQRTVLFLMPVKHHPNVAYVKKVRTWKMHAFTGCQLLFLGVLWGVKESPASLIFPFLLLLLIPLRLFIFPLVFTATELNALDGEEANAAMNDDGEPDFYEEVHGLPTHNHVHQS